MPVRKPRQQDFVRVHPDAEFRQPFAVIELKDDRERYLVMPQIAAALPTEIVTEMLYTTINRQRVVSLWPVRLPASDGRVNEWHRSARADARAVQAMRAGGAVRHGRREPGRANRPAASSGTGSVAGAP